MRQGETVRYVVRNAGKVTHERVLGTLDELRQRAEPMRRLPHMEREAPSTVPLSAGDSGAISWPFTEAGESHFGRLVPGHVEAGMEEWINVLARAAPAKSR